MAGIHATQESQGKRAVTDNLHTLFTKLTAFALVLVVCVSVAACGDSPEEVATSDKKPKLANAEQVYGRSAMRLMSSIAQLRGHYFAAKELYAKGDKKGALVHADHPVDDEFQARQAHALVG